MAIVNYLGANPIPINIDTNRYDQSHDRAQKADSFDKIMQSKKNNVLKAQDKNASIQDKTEGLRKKAGSNSIKTTQTNKNGTDFALKKIASEKEQQFYSIMWNQAFATVGEDFEGGLAEELFRKELIEEMVKGATPNETGELAEAIYEEARRNQGIKDEHRPTTGIKNDIRPSKVRAKEVP